MFLSSFRRRTERGSRNGAKYRRRVFFSENSRGRKRGGKGDTVESYRKTRAKRSNCSQLLIINGLEPIR